MDDMIILSVALYIAAGFMTVISFVRPLEEGSGIHQLQRWLRITIRMAFFLLWPIPFVAMVCMLLFYLLRYCVKSLIE